MKHVDELMKLAPYSIAVLNLNRLIKRTDQLDSFHMLDALRLVTFFFNILTLISLRMGELETVYGQINSNSY